MTSPIDDLGWLMEEPYYLRPDEIAKLTDMQIVGLYGKERDEKGVPKRVGVSEARKFRTPEEIREQTIGILAMFGKSRAEAEEIFEKAKLKKR